MLKKIVIAPDNSKAIDFLNNLNKKKGSIKKFLETETIAAKHYNDKITQR